MRFESWRLSTFSHVQNRLAVSTLRLAHSGFYYDEERDDIVCFSCNLRKRDWDKSDPIAVVHLELSPDCDQANFRDDRNVPVSKYPHVGPTDESSVLPGLSQQTHHGSRDDSGGFSTDDESTDASGATGTVFSAISTSQTFHTDPQSAAENNRNASRDNIPQRDPESSTKYPSSGTPFSGKTHTNSSLAAQSAETVVQHVSLSHRLLLPALPLRWEMTRPDSSTPPQPPPRHLQPAVRPQQHNTMDTLCNLNRTGMLFQIRAALPYHEDGMTSRLKSTTVLT